MPVRAWSVGMVSAASQGELCGQLFSRAKSILQIDPFIICVHEQTNLFPGERTSTTYWVTL